MNTDTKFSIKEAFKSAFKIFRQNLFAILTFMFFCAITILAIILLTPILVSIDIHGYSATESVIGVLGKPSPHNQLLFYCMDFILGNLISFLFVNTFLPAFEGSKVKFRNYFPNFKKVFKALLVTILLAAVPLVISISEVLVFGSKSFVNFFVRNERFFYLADSILGDMLVFFYIEIARGESILQSIRNIQESLSKAFSFFMLLEFCAILSLIPLIVAESDILLNLTLFVGELFVIAPLSTLVLISAYTQVVLSKAYTLKNNVTENRKILLDDDLK